MDIFEKIFRKRLDKVVEQEIVDLAHGLLDRKKRNEVHVELDDNLEISMPGDGPYLLAVKRDYHADIFWFEGPTKWKLVRISEEEGAVFSPHPTNPKEWVKNPLSAKQ